MTKTEFTHRHPAIAMLLASILAVSLSTMLIHRIEAAGTRNMSITGFAFNPQYAVVPRGYKVAWTNNDPVIHTLWFVKISDQSTYLVSDPINPGATWSYTFNDFVNLQYYDFNRLWISGSLRISLAGDVNGDGIVDIFDAIAFAGAFGSTPSQPNWNPDCDFAASFGVIDIFDAIVLAGNFGARIA